MLALILLIPILAIANAFDWPWEQSTTLLSAQSTPTGVSAASYYSSLLEISYLDGLAYAPKRTACPTAKVVREALEISSQEENYVRERQAVTNENLKEFLNDVGQLLSFDADEFITNASKNISIGLAFSGGGYRAMLSGAGAVLAMDKRYKNLTETGLGGLLQSATYITGLSGGSWLVGTLSVNNWISVGDILESDSGIWDLSDLIFNPNGINFIKTFEYYNELRKAVLAKQNSGFETSITDVWGRSLSYQFFNNSFYNGGENFTWSGVRNLESFVEREMPFPIFVANGRNPGTVIVNENSTIMEMSPFELGSWDTSLNSFVDCRYLGTKLDNGMPNSTECITDFDNAGFFMGTSSSLFNEVFLKLETLLGLNWLLKRLLKTILSGFSDTNVDIASYNPNPFYNSEYADSENIISMESLNLADGGEDGQNVPYYPLIQKARNVDVIFSFDNSADTDNNWPNGSAIVSTYKRQFNAQGYGTVFPYVPSVETFIDEGLNTGPVFFGCNASALSDLVKFHGSKVNNTDVPLVVYIPASKYLYDANKSTYKMSYTDSEVRSMIQNGFEVASKGNVTEDEAWGTCVACAIIRREQERSGEEQSDECKRCFDDYCWTGGVEDSAVPAAEQAFSAMSLLMASETSSNSTMSKTSSSSKASSTSSSTSKTSSSKKSSLSSSTSKKSSSKISSTSSGKTTSSSAKKERRDTSPQNYMDNVSAIASMTSQLALSALSTTSSSANGVEQVQRPLSMVLMAVSMLLFVQ